MKIHVRSFALSFSIIFTLLMLVLTVWSRLSLTFGNAFMDVFVSVHPNPYSALRPGLDLAQHAAGAAFDVFYALVDSLVFSLSFAYLYNAFLPKSAEEATDKDTTGEA